MKRSLGYVAAIALLALSLAAPASAATHKAKKPPTVKQAAAAYLAAVGPFNAALDQLNAKTATWTTNTPAAQQAADVAPMLTAYKKFDSFVKRYKWPAVAKTDAQRLLQNDQAVRSDYGQLGKVTLLGSSLLATLQTDANAASAAANLIRKDLKLPPVTATGSPTSMTGHVGATLSLAGTTADADVTLSSIQDPAQGGDHYTTPDAGKRFVAATLMIKNTGSGGLTGDADSDSTIVGSDGQIYSPVLDSLAGCTDFGSGQFQLGPGESATGCVAFQVPNGVTVTKFKFAPNSGAASDFGEWTVP